MKNKFCTSLKCGLDTPYLCLSIEKKLNEVINALLTNWIRVFGVIRAIFTDNGGEFRSEEIREVMSILNVHTCTTAVISSFQRGFVGKGPCSH